MRHPSWQSRNRPDLPSVRPPKDEARASPRDLVASLVQQAVVEAAEENEIVDARRPAMRPVPDVMGIDGAVVRAAGETAASVAATQCAAQRGRHRARLATDAQRPSGTLDQRDDGGVAGKPPRGLGSERLAVGKLAAAVVGPVPQRGGIDVDEDLEPITAGA